MFARMLKIILLDMIPSFLDIGTDLINSLDMIGFNMTSTIITEVVNTVTDVAGNGTFFSDLLPEVGNSTSSYHEDFIWGGVGLALIFAPGIPMAITFLIDDFKDVGSWCAAVFAFTCYPICIFIVQFWGICDSYVADMGIVWAVGGEAFFESGPQMVLQLFTIQYGYQTGPLQIATICLSFFLLAKTAVMFDLLHLEDNGLYTQFDNSWKICCIEIPIQKIQHVLTVIPAYTTGIMFRIGALSITTAYLRYWSIIPIILLIVQYAVTANHLGYHRRDILFAAISNLGSMTRRALSDNKGKWTDVKSSTMFLVISAMLTFFYHCTCLVTILVMTTVSPSYFSHWETRLVFFHYTNPIIFGVIGMGIINLILIFATGDKLNGPKMMKSMESIPHEEIGLMEMNKEGSSKVFSAEVENDVLDENSVSQTQQEATLLTVSTDSKWDIPAVVINDEAQESSSFTKNDFSGFTISGIVFSDIGDNSAIRSFGDIPNCCFQDDIESPTVEVKSSSYTSMESSSNANESTTSLLLESSPSTLSKSSSVQSVVRDKGHIANLQLLATSKVEIPMSNDSVSKMESSSESIPASEQPFSSSLIRQSMTTKIKGGGEPQVVSDVDESTTIIEYSDASAISVVNEVINLILNRIVISNTITEEGIDT